jgi:inosine-uridine nucleoside N-ribohydrolase
MPVPGTAPVHDALCVGFLVDASLIKTRRLHVAVETHGTLTVGRTVVDTHFRGGGAPNCDVAFDADGDRFAALLIDTLARTAAPAG